MAKLDTIELAGFGKALITNPSVSFSYDRERVDTIVAELTQTHPEIAAQLTSARKRSERAGGLRIEGEKAKVGAGTSAINGGMGHTRHHP